MYNIILNIVSFHNDTCIVRLSIRNKEGDLNECINVTNILTLEVLMKLVFAALLSLIIGIERELKKKPVGFKTSFVIATFSCLLTIHFY